MIESAQLHELAYKAERLASRRLARLTGKSYDDALLITLEAAAGSDGLALLLAGRHALVCAAAEREKRKAQRLAVARSERAARHYGAPTPWQGWFDGSAHPNPGRCGIGAVLIGPDALRREISRPAGFGNSSEAEYAALLALLHEAVAAGAHELTIYGDSRVVIDDVTGCDANAAPTLTALRSNACDLITRLGGVTLRWLPRHKNADADALSQRAIAQSGNSECET